MSNVSTTLTWILPMSFPVIACCTSERCFRKVEFWHYCTPPTIIHHPSSIIPHPSSVIHHPSSIIHHPSSSSSSSIIIIIIHHPSSSSMIHDPWSIIRIIHSQTVTAPTTTAIQMDRPERLPSEILGPWPCRERRNPAVDSHRSHHPHGHMEKKRAQKSWIERMKISGVKPSVRWYDGFFNIYIYV